MTHSGLSYFELALALMKTGQYQEAEPALLRSMQLVPNPTANHYYRLGVLYMLQNRLTEAKAMQHNALKLNPKFIGPDYQFGLIHAKEGNYAEAALHFDNALALGDPNRNLKKHLVTAMIRAAPDDFDYARALDLCPDHPLLEKYQESQRRTEC